MSTGATPVLPGESERAQVDPPEGWVPGRPPYGFRVCEGALAPDAAEQEVLVAIIESARAGGSANAIARELNRRGVPTRLGRLWHHDVVLGILRRHVPELAPALSERPPPVPQQHHPAEVRRRDRERKRRQRRAARAQSSTPANEAP